MIVEKKTLWYFLKQIWHNKYHLFFTRKFFLEFTSQRKLEKWIDCVQKISLTRTIFKGYGLARFIFHTIYPWIFHLVFFYAIARNFQTSPLFSTLQAPEFLSSSSRISFYWFSAWKLKLHLFRMIGKIEFKNFHFWNSEKTQCHRHSFFCFERAKFFVLGPLTPPLEILKWYWVICL